MRIGLIVGALLALTLTTVQAGREEQVFEGWNLVPDWSGPTATSAAGVQSVMDDVTDPSSAWSTVAFYDGEGWLQTFADPPLPSFNTLTALVPAADYWVFVEADATLNLGEPAASFGPGTHAVGTDIPPGTYRNSGSDGCYWARLSGFSGELKDIIANSFTNVRQIVTIAASDEGFETTAGCGTWSSDLSPITASPTADFGGGTFQVGPEIAPGTWRAGADDGCYWERLSDFSGELDGIIANEFSDEQQIVEIEPSDVGFHSEGCAAWTKIG